MLLRWRVPVPQAAQRGSKVSRGRRASEAGEGGVRGKDGESHLREKVRDTQRLKGRVTAPAWAQSWVRHSRHDLSSDWLAR